MANNPIRRDKPLFTPGPLTTSETVKRAMLRDLGPRDHEFKRILQEIRGEILHVAGVSQELGFEAIPLQGCGTMGIEAVLSSVVPSGGKVLVVVNGAYGRRILEMANVLPGIEPVALTYEEDQQPLAEDIDDMLRGDPEIAMVVAVHCETTSGIMNPIREIGEVVRRHGRDYFVDSMSAFGGVEFDFQACQIDYLVSSANKCIQGVPGFSFVVCRRDKLEASAGSSRTLSLDLLRQLRGFEFDGQFLYTPPTHSMLAFRQALIELEEEGGVPARAERYRQNHEILVEGMRQLGFETFLPGELQSHIITTFHEPQIAAFDFNDFYDRVEEKGFVIYGGKVLHQKSFRIGTIGHIFADDVRALLVAVRVALEEMSVEPDRKVGVVES
jgi:2-aminoethylphosphonate-pyruvate transaminase